MVNILIVEDNEMNRDMLARRLGKKGFNTSIAIDGEEGIDKATSEKPDLILMDLSLPKIDGWEATRRLKACQETCGIPIIALTAHAMSGDRDKALKAGSDDYDTKPVDMKRLLAKIEACIEKARESRKRLENAAAPQAPTQASPSPATEARAASAGDAGGPSDNNHGEDAEKKTAISQAEIDDIWGVSSPEAGKAVPKAASYTAEEGPSWTAAAVAHELGEPIVGPETELAPGPNPLADDHINEKLGHLLIVDDNENNREVLSRRFVKEGYTTETAENGEEALELIALRNFDVVLLDIMMPGIDGVEVLKRIRKQFRMVELPVIMVTAKDDRDELINALGLGANDFIPKPVDYLVALARTRTQLQLKAEHERSERLLCNILPKLVADLLKSDVNHFAERYPEATVMFSDIVGFTQISGDLEAKVLVRLLNEIFSGFDDLAAKHDLEKIKTMGDGYMVVGGVPEHRKDHCEAIANMALEMRDFLESFNQRLRHPLGIRMGIHTGPVVAGVIGKTKFAYDLWGDTVNVASRMESTSGTGQIQVTTEVHECLKGKFEFVKRGLVEVKGKGQMETYFLLDHLK